MHIIRLRKFCCIYQIVKEVDFLQLERSYNPFNKTIETQDMYGHAQSNFQYGKFPSTVRNAPPHSYAELCAQEIVCNLLGPP